MTEAKKILEMIERVDLEDRDTLDEIDARVWCLKENLEFTSYNTDRGYVEYNGGGPDYHYLGRQDLFTRSRDALKSIRPEGSSISLSITPEGTTYQFWVPTDLDPRPYPYESDSALPTEELAELHAIVQAWDYERNQ